MVFITWLMCCCCCCFPLYFFYSPVDQGVCSCTQLRNQQQHINQIRNPSRLQNVRWHTGITTKVRRPLGVWRWFCFAGVCLYARVLLPACVGTSTLRSTCFYKNRKKRNNNKPQKKNKKVPNFLTYVGAFRNVLKVGTKNNLNFC